jgi:acetylglutamate kinase
MSGPLVIKVGGSTLGSADSTYADIATIARDDVPIVVHGGGAEASRWLEAMGIVSRFENGLRVTDEAALPVIVAVYAGLVNKRIVAAINAAGGLAAGLCGADACLVECDRSNPELGFVGNPREVHRGVLDALRAATIVPVIGPIGFTREDTGLQLVNVNADTIAGAVAAEVGASEAVFLTDVEGVRGADGTVAERLTVSAAERLIEQGVASGGMIPKLRACIATAKLGVPARILDGRQPGALLDRQRRGTVVSART